ncbi:MAG: putative selenium-dependent hydroxylase accessory protein YqeC [Candidatus Marinimicrobia bacterium]|nr:putative selenium-dependent hydroxylase accessory protein YqeC [Candidatus Neomarinimicrobiota bacterium]
MDFSILAFPDHKPAPNSCIALLGGGGKTGLQQRLGRELSRQHDRVLLTSITKSAFHSEPRIIYRAEIVNDDLSPWFVRHNPLCLMGTCLNADKVDGIEVTDLEHFKNQADITIVECDGARNRPLKVHCDHDPIVPDFFDQVIVIVGADVVDTTLSDGLVHRPELFATYWGIADDFVLTLEFIAEVVTSQKGYSSKIPTHLPRTYFVNKTDAHPGQASALAQAIFAASGRPTWYGSVQKDSLTRMK